MKPCSKKMTLKIYGNKIIAHMIIFEFKKYGPYLGTRQLGARIREELLPIVKGEEKVELNFEGVEVVSNSFADECLAKLLYEFSIDELKKRTTFSCLNDFAKKNIVIAFRRRSNAIKKEAS